MREKIIALMKEVVFPAFPGGGLDVKFKDQLPEHGFRAIADHIIANGVTFATDNNVGGKWIPLTERLPEDNVRVIAYRPMEADVSAYKYCVMWGWSVKASMRHVGIAHWMPLPEPPKEGE